MDKIKIENKTNLIFWHKFFNSIADSVIKIFIPLYILKITGSVALSFGYMAIYSLFVVIFNYVLKDIIQRYGVVCIILHFIPIIFAEAMLNFCPINWIVLVGVALLMALAQALYSVSINLVFLFGEKNNNIAKFEIGTCIGKLVFILLGGFVLSSEIKNSFLWLSIISAVFYIISVIPIWFSEKVLKNIYDFNRIKTEKYSENVFFNFKISKNNNLLLIFHIGFGLFQAIIVNCLPIFVYLNGLSFNAVAILLALIELFKIISNHSAKILIAKHKQKCGFVISFVVFILSLMGIMFIKNSIVIYVLTCLCSIVFPFMFVPMFKIFGDEIEDKKTVGDEMIKRDVDIFSFRPLEYMAPILGFGLYPCFAFGILGAVLMFWSALKLFKETNVI